MKRILVALALAGIGASLASAQDSEDALDINASLNAIKAETGALKKAPRPSPKKPAKKSHLGLHRIGHAKEEVNPTPAPEPPVNTAQVPDISAYPIHGMDVSHYENTIPWDQVKTEGLSFAYIKSTEGGDYVDPDFQTNWQGAAGAGMAEGAYHFYNFCKTGAEQAANFIKTVPRTAGALPMVIDLEESADCTTWPAQADFLVQLSSFVGQVKAVYGLTPILYINLSIYDRYLSNGAGAAYRLWIADPSHVKPDMPAGVGWTFWQYSWHGTVAGIGSEVDLDVFNGDAQAFSQLSQP
jgi:lysozyme